ncbi:MAG: hypothetical protein AAF567_19010 [Actinomycetota bacterium]
MRGPAAITMRHVVTFLLLAAAGAIIGTAVADWLAGIGAILTGPRAVFGIGIWAIALRTWPSKRVTPASLT